MEKKIFSLNLMAYIICKTGYKPQLTQNDEGSIFAIFPECDEINNAIKEFKRDLKLHDYLECFKKIKENIYQIRQVRV